jgi:hypothetical protein
LAGRRVGEALEGAAEDVVVLGGLDWGVVLALVVGDDAGGGSAGCYASSLNGLR